MHCGGPYTVLVVEKFVALFRRTSQSVSRDLGTFLPICIGHERTNHPRGAPYSRARAPPRRGRPGRGGPGPLSVPGAPGSGDRAKNAQSEGPRHARPPVPPSGTSRGRRGAQIWGTKAGRFGSLRFVRLVSMLVRRNGTYCTATALTAPGIMRRRSHRACHYYVERRRTAGPTSMLCVASPGVAVLLSLSLSLSLARARPLALLTDWRFSSFSRSPLSRSLLSLSLSLSLAQAAYRRTKC